MKRILKGFYFFFKGILRRCTPLPVMFYKPLNSQLLNPWGQSLPLENLEITSSLATLLFRCLLRTQHRCQRQLKKKQGGLYHRASSNVHVGTWLPHIKRRGMRKTQYIHCMQSWGGWGIIIGLWRHWYSIGTWGWIKFGSGWMEWGALLMFPNERKGIHLGN